MPTKQWMHDHRQITFWLTQEEKRALIAACRAEGKKVTNVMRDAALLMIEKNGGPDA